MLRFDGLYVGPPRQTPGDAMVFFDYLRFYEDGWVINCVSSGTPEQVIRWFYRDNPGQTGLLQDLLCAITRPCWVKRLCGIGVSPVVIVDDAS